MSEYDLIQDSLRKVVWRRRWHRAWLGLWQGLLIGGAAWVIALSIYKLFPIPYDWVLWVGAAALVGVGANTLRMACQRLSIQETARWVDQKKGLHERISTAVELAPSVETTRLDEGGDPRDPRAQWARLVVRDAAEHAKGIDRKELLPWRLPRMAPAVLGVLALGAGLGFVPEYRTDAYRERQAERAVMQEAGEEMARIVRHELDREPQLDSTAKEKLAEAEELGRRLKEGELERREALQELSRVSDRLEEEARQAARSPGMQRMRHAARQRQESASSSSAASQAGLQQKMEALQKKLDEAAQNGEQVRDLKKKLEKAKAKASGMAGANSEAAAAARQQLAESLAELRDSNQNLAESLPALQEAIEALKEGQIDRALTEMDQSLDQLTSLEEQAEALEQLQDQLDALGETLAEQLERGQTTMARNTLEEMARKLQSADLPDEALQAMLDEVKEALEPAEFYGEAGELLENAAGELGEGAQEAAADSLMAAAEALKDLEQQMGGLESLAKAMQALQQAGLCVGNGMGWGECAGMMAGMGLGQGLKFGDGQGVNLMGSGPSGGTGTWAPEEMPWVDEVPLSSYNQGLAPPDMTPRGVSDEETPELSENLEPTKVQGEFSEGGPMPSIRLEGVSIKGQSQAEFRESVSAAQKDAQSALSQKRVPQSHQDRVRQYFDELE